MGYTEVKGHPAMLAALADAYALPEACFQEVAPQEGILLAYAALLAHTKEKPDLWDAALTKHTPEQTGLACYHYARGALTEASTFELHAGAG